MGGWQSANGIDGASLLQAEFIASTDNDESAALEISCVGGLELD